MSAPARDPAMPARPFWDAPVHHEIKFERNAIDGRFRAMCSCGWARIGDGREEGAIRVAAGSHDLEWVRELDAERFPTAQS